ncbi:MAG: glycerol-3-phosphate dehydrogenase [Betaproteobacteria bacterium]|nr:glycerol-3-phosphate dehydrogenase [Betaproteobacteria bacterium]
MADPGTEYDLLIIGGGINGAGIARDAAGRGLKVLLVEKDDLAAATSSASSKLIHGGLRYLEQYEFRLVAEAVGEREVLLKIAPHLVTPLTFVMPHVPELRPLANALSARDLGAEIATRTECKQAMRVAAGWEAVLRATRGAERTVLARGIVNAAGPWVKQVLNDRLHQPSRDNVKLVKGSHIVVPRAYAGEHALILQTDDRRVVFMIPYEARYTLIGTTDVEFAGDPARPGASAQEIGYLCRAVNRYLAQPLAPADVVWSYAGVRPLYDDGSADPSAVTRDYTLRLDAERGAAPVLSVFGGKITTYRKLAEHALDKLAPWFPHRKAAWTANASLPGGELDGSLEAFHARLANEYAALPAALLQALARRHGSLVPRVLQGVRTEADLGTHFGADLYAREVDYMLEHEWAGSGEDVLYRRTKAGLHLAPAQREAVAYYVAQRAATR